MVRKRKLSSRSAQVYDSHQSTLPTSSINTAEQQPVSVGEGNEMLERKRSRMESLDEGIERKRKRKESIDEGTERKRKDSFDEIPERKRKRKENFDDGPERKRSQESFEKLASLNISSPGQGQQVEDQAFSSSFQVLPPLNQQVEIPLALVQDSQVSSASTARSKVDMIIEDDILSRYELARMLGEGGFGTVYEGKRLKDGLEVAVKIARKPRKMQYISFPGHPAPLPLEVGLMILVNKGPDTPEIIRLLDWQDQLDRYIMVLERPSPCEDLLDFLDRHRGTFSEDIAQIIMLKATRAAFMCCHRGVLHRDIKMENLLINPETLEIKLIDFGCGDLLKESGYDEFVGTEDYCPPEFDMKGRYHGKPATVWSLGMLLFAMVCGRFPEPKDLGRIDDDIWFEPGLSNECCHLIRSLLQQDPRRRIGLEKILFHGWFKYDSDSEGNYRKERKRKSSSGKLLSLHSSDTIDSPGQGQQVQDETTISVDEQSTDDQSSPSTSSTSAADEGPERNRRRTDSVETVSSLSFSDRRGSPDQNVVDHGLQEPLSSGLEGVPPADQQNILSWYEIGRMLGQGGYGSVYEGRRMEDGLEVAVKIARKQRNMKYINIPGHPAPVPLEVGLLILVNEDPKLPQIIQLLDWQDQPDHYIMVLERPSPCEDLWHYVTRCGGILNEFVARLVMWQVTHAAQVCCMRGVLHRDIKLQNLLINPETLKVKLIDFGCGDLLKESAYRRFWGTEEYCPPEFDMEGWYHGKPATVWSLGVLLFAMVCGRFPGPIELLTIDMGIWSDPGLSDECCRLIQCLLQKNPSQRIALEEILHHSWFTITQ